MTEQNIILDNPFRCPKCKDRFETDKRLNKHFIENPNCKIFASECIMLRLTGCPAEYGGKCECDHEALKGN